MAQPELVVNVSLAAKQYVAAGLVLVPFERGTKGPAGPGYTGWNTREKCIETIEKASNLYCNIGLAHAYCDPPTCCIDIDDMPNAVSWFACGGIDLEALWNHSNAVRLTSGRINRGKLIYRIPAGVGLLRTRAFKGDGLELRCATAEGLTVQDVLPPSIHPITHQPYKWLGPGDWRDIPALPADVLALWKSLFERKLRASGPVEPMGVGLAEIQGVLDRIVAQELHYDDWLKVGSALHHETRGAPAGQALWERWSFADGKNTNYNYERANFDGRYSSFHVDHENPVTLRSLEWMTSTPEDMSSEWQPIEDDEPVQDIEVPQDGDVLRVLALDLRELTCIPAEPDIIVDALMLQDACGFVAPGGTGKTTLAIYEAVHIILGRTLWGRAILKPGNVLFLTAEDSRATVASRLNRIVAALQLSHEDMQRVADGFYIEDVSASSGRLVGTDSKGRIRTTKLLAEIIRRYAALHLSLVHLDPASLLGPGEQTGNDGMSELMRAARRISLETHAACQIVHHVSQAVARTGIQDQYAGRGGTAFADNSRGQRQLVRVMERQYEFNGRRFRIPETVSDDDLSSGRVLAILVHKLSYVELNPYPIFLTRHGFGFEQFEAECQSPRGSLTTDEQTQVLIGLIERDMHSGIYHSISTLELRSKDIAMTQKRVRDLLKGALEQGAVYWAHTPKAEGAKGGKLKHLAIAEDVISEL